MKTIRDRISDLRMEHQLSALQVNQALGWGKSTVERFEQGKQTPNKEQEAQLASFFKVSVAYLRAETNDKTRQDSWMDMALDADRNPEPPAPPQARQEEAPPQAGQGASVLSAMLKSEEAQRIIREIVNQELDKRLHP